MTRRNFIWLALVAAALLLTCWLSAANAATPTVGNGTAVVASKPVSGDLPATLTGPSEMVAGTFVQFTLDVDATRVSWKCLSSVSAADYAFFSLQSFQGMNGNKPIVQHIAFFSPRKTGTYHVTVAAVNGDKLAHLVLDVKVTGTNPEPDPDPTPPPVPGEKIVVVVRETQQATPVEAQVLQGLRSWCKSQNRKYRIEDDDLQDSLITQCLSKASAAGIAAPFLAVATVSSDDGKTVVDFRGRALPNTSADAVKFVQENGG